MRIGRTLPPAAAPIGWKNLLSGISALFKGEPELNRFSGELKDFFGMPHCFLVSSGKTALTLILHALKEQHPDRDEVIRVRTLSEQCAGPFCFKIDWVGDILEPKNGYLIVKTIPELSSFESGTAIWELRAQGERTWVLHESSLKPNFFIPPVIGAHIMQKQMEDDTLDIFKRIGCYANLMFEMDMVNEPELINNVLKGGKDCINPQG